MLPSFVRILDSPLMLQSNSRAVEARLAALIYVILAVESRAGWWACFR